MKNKGTGFFLTLLLVLVTACSNDQGETVEGTEPVVAVPIVTSIGGSLNDNANAVIATADGGYAVLGHTQSADGDVTDKTDTSFDYWLLKYTAEGTLQWSKRYGGSGDDRGNDIVETTDGGYAILGYSTSADGDASQNAGAQDYWIVKVSAVGELQWERSYGFSGRDEALSLIQTSDQGFLVVGELDVTASQGEGITLQRQRHAGGNYWALKLDSSGMLEWSNFFGGTFTDSAFEVVATNDDGYLIIGSSDSNDVDISDNKGSYDFWVVKIAAEGSLLWQKSYGGSEIDQARAAVATGNGNYLIVGDTRSSDQDISLNNGGADVWLLNIDNEGNILWERTFGGSAFDVGRDICPSQDGGYYITGSSRSLDGAITTNKGKNDVWLLKIDESGTLEQQWTFGGSEIDFGHSVTQLQNGIVVVVGESASTDGDLTENKGFTDMIKIELR